LPFNVESEDLDAVVVFPVNSLFTGVELFAFIDVLSAGVTTPETGVRMGVRTVRRYWTYIEKGAIKRTTCCEFFGPFLRGMSEGSKSGGKYLFNTNKIYQ
jgi:hypothetical protein